MWLWSCVDISVGVTGALAGAAAADTSAFRSTKLAELPKIRNAYDGISLMIDGSLPQANGRRR